MRLGGSRTNNKKISERGNPAQIHDDDRFRLLVGSELGAEFSQGFGFYLATSR
jgi:hypothetical protein